MGEPPTPLRLCHSGLLGLGPSLLKASWAWAPCARQTLEGLVCKRCPRLVQPLPPSGPHHKGCWALASSEGPLGLQERWSWRVKATYAKGWVSAPIASLATDVGEVSPSHLASPEAQPPVTQWNQRKRFLTSYPRGGEEGREVLPTGVFPGVRMPLPGLGGRAAESRKP